MKPEPEREPPGHWSPGRWSPGPGLLVTAAFVGPGTVVTASRAGAEFGLALLWAIGLAVLAAAVLQEQAARLGLVSRRGLVEAISESIPSAAARSAALALVLLAIVLGNTAYQTGNLIGAGVGLAVLTGGDAQTLAAGLGVAVAGLLAAGGSGRLVKGLLTAVVLAMSAALLTAACVAQPDPTAVAAGIFIPRLPAGSAMTVLALIGTTVVPYNLFLHASAVQQRWPETGQTAVSMRWVRIDSAVAIAFGGLVTMAIVATSAAAFAGNETRPATAAEFTRQLQPLLGEWGQSLFAAGLAAAGLTSAVTAPLAVGIVARGVLPASGDRAARLTSVAVALIGAGLAYGFGKSPSQTIVAAQAANGVLLPLVAVFLLAAMNRAALLGEHRNGWRLNLLGGGVAFIAAVLGVKNLWLLFA